MHRPDSSKFLLYMEPLEGFKNVEPKTDKLTTMMEYAFAHAIQGAANYSDVGYPESFNEGYGYRGFHDTDCGMHSDNHDYLLENGMITNSLCVFYVKYYRESIPTTERIKLMSLYNYYTLKGIEF